MSESFSIYHATDQEIVQTSHLERATEVADSVPQVETFLKNFIIRSWSEDPHKAVKVVWAGEAGAGKGTLDTQFLEILRRDTQLQGTLESLHMEFSPHTFSTALMIQEAKKRSVPVETSGRPTPDGINGMGKITDEMLRTAEAALPDQEGMGAHLFWYEFVGISPSIDLGNTVLHRLSEDPNAVVIFNATNSETHQNSYSLRRRLRLEMDKGKVLHDKNVKVDIPAERLLSTQGDDISVGRVAVRLNTDMHDAFVSGDFKEPLDTLAEYGVNISAEKEVQEFFAGLTEFTEEEMVHHPSREALVNAWCYYLADKVYQFPQERYMVISPDFIGDRTVNPHPGFFEQYALQPNAFLPSHRQLDEMGEVVFTDTSVSSDTFA